MQIFCNIPTALSSSAPSASPTVRPPSPDSSPSDPVHPVHPVHPVIRSPSSPSPVNPENPVILSHSSSELPRLESLVTQILDAKKSDPAANTQPWEDEIDQIDYHLYGLTDDEIAIVEGRA